MTVSIKLQDGGTLEAIKTSQGLVFRVHRISAFHGQPIDITWDEFKTLLEMIKTGREKAI